MTAPRFANVSCSQCGRDFGPGDAGYSHCWSHPGPVRDRERDAAHDLLIALRRMADAYYAPTTCTDEQLDALQMAHEALEKSTGETQ